MHEPEAGLMPRLRIIHSRQILALFISRRFWKPGHRLKV
jgi:hypothetical protein